MNLLEPIESPRPAATMRLPRRGAVPPLLGLVALGVVLAAGMILAVDSAAAPSFAVAHSDRWTGWLAGPLSLLPGSRVSGPTYAELTYVMSAAYLVAVACSRWIGLRAALTAIVALHLVFVLAPPLGSADVWTYIGFSHLGALHHVSPYAHVPIDLGQDPAYPWNAYPTPTPYGPLFTLLSYAIAPLGLAGGLWTLKALMGAAALGSLWLVALCARRLGLNPVPALIFVGLSPAWLVWMVGGAHNDPLMLLLSLGGVALWLAGRDLPAAFLVVLAAGVKLPALLLLPFLVIAAGDRGRALRGAAAGLVAVAAASLAGFGSLTPFVSFEVQNRLHTTRSPIGQLVRLFIGGGASLNQARLPAVILLVIAVSALIVWAARSGRALAAAGWATVALLVTQVWEFPWYVSWLVPLAALAGDTRLKVAALGLSVMLLAVYVSPALIIV